MPPPEVRVSLARLPVSLLRTIVPWVTPLFITYTNGWGKLTAYRNTEFYESHCVIRKCSYLLLGSCESCTSNTDCVATNCGTGSSVVCQHPSGNTGIVAGGGLCTCQSTSNGELYYFFTRTRYRNLRNLPWLNYAFIRWTGYVIDHVPYGIVHDCIHVHVFLWGEYTAN